MNNNYCKASIKRFEKKEGTKTVWVEIESTEKEIDEQYYKNIVAAAPFFRRLGGTETQQKGYTSKGYLVTNCISTSPDKQKRTVYSFDFDI